MQNTNDFSKALSEVDFILKYTDKNLTQNISQKFFEFIRENKDKEYEVTINENILLENQNIREDTKNLMAYIYRNYFCNLEQKKEYDNLLNENQYRYDEKLKEKYSYENLFKNNTIRNEKAEKQDSVNLQMIEYVEESIIRRFINIIKNFFTKFRK